GLVPLQRIDGALAFEAPPTTRSGPVSAADLERITRVLGIEVEEVVDSRWADNGPGWVAVMLASAQEVLELRPIGDDEHIDIGVVGMYPEGSECAYEVRAIFTNDRREICEDPVTGSLNASLAQWLIGAGRVTPPYTASQGTLMGRAGRPRISQDGSGAIWVGGATHTIVRGEVVLE
ncbi:MAG: PhzF family phenazine biosynthesis protein, partial [Candidatus Limnocylindrales bacterium]